MVADNVQLLDSMIRLVRAATSADFAEVTIGEHASLNASIGTSPTGESLVNSNHLISGPQAGLAKDLTALPELQGSIAIHPVTGPSAEQGILLVFSADPDAIGTEALEHLGNATTLIERHLDQVVERIRLDQLSDILHSKQTELHETHARLELSNTELEQFAYIAAHELIAPLRSVAVYAQVLDMNPGELESEQLASCAREIREGVSLMDHQLRNLLELSSTQTQAADPVPVALTEIVENAVASVHEEIRSAGATIEIGELPTVSGKPALLQSVFVNLISNAVKYRDLSKSLHISVEATSTDEALHHIRVKDNGPGINLEDRDRIFRLFERASTSTATPGSGIGLGLSRRIVEAFGGTLAYESSKGGGSCFKLTFPFWSGPMSSAEPSRSP